MIASSFLPEALLAERPHLFSAATVPVAVADLVRMAELIAAVERVVALPQWQERAGKVGAGDTAAGTCVGTGSCNGGGGDLRRCSSCRWLS